MQSRRQIVKGASKCRRVISDICRKIDVDRSVSAELKGRGEIVIRGCRRICEYTPRVISLKINSGKINVCGNDLTCFAFSSSDIGIRGSIKCIFFTDEKRNCGNRK